MKKDNSEEIEKIIERHVGLLSNQEALIKASNNLSRRKNSPLGSKIRKGDLKAIFKVAQDRFYGSMSKVKRREFCLLICELEEKYRKDGKERKKKLLRILIEWIIPTAFGYVNRGGPKNLNNGLSGYALATVA
ncbi:MAG: hypothetical protein AB7T38_13135 [Nitrospirales bacterium]